MPGFVSKTAMLFGCKKCYEKSSAILFEKMTEQTEQKRTRLSKNVQCDGVSVLHEFIDGDSCDDVLGCEQTEQKRTRLSKNVQADDVSVLRELIDGDSCDDVLGS